MIALCFGSAAVNPLSARLLAAMLCAVLCCAGDVLRDMGLRDAFNVQLSVPALNGDAVATVLRALDCFSSGEVLQVRRSACLPVCM